ncbi:MAG TPA: MFS transporter [Candidatus Binatia bacterium]|jgi:MFS family permease|nr:MFS transporter [Candidatus Binatia bacterium]
MSRKQLCALFLCSLVPWTVGNGLIPLLPVYAIQLGATPVLVGYYLACSYLALAIGTIVAGGISDRLQRRKTLLIAAGLVSIPVMWLMSRATNVWHLAVLTAVVWFCGGVGLSLVSILTGLLAKEAERGKVFGVLALTGALGTLIGGLTMGVIADRWGYPTLFVVVAVFLALWPLTGVLLEDKVVARVRGGGASATGDTARFGGDFFLLLLASVVAGVAVFVGLLGVSLVMNKLSFVSTAIASTAAVGGAVTLPLPPMMGWLSDRLGRKRLLALCYLSGMVGLLVLAASVSLWHFWAAASLLYIFAFASRGVGSALATDLVSQKSLGVGMSLFEATRWVGGIIGFTAMGYAVQNLGITSTFILGAVLSLTAVILLIPIQPIGSR